MRRRSIAWAGGGALVLAAGTGARVASLSRRRARAQTPGLEGAWRDGASIPTERSEVAVATTGGAIFVLGGLIQDGRTVQTVEALPAGADRWEPRAPLPLPRDLLGAVEMGGQLYAVAGSPGWFGQQASNTLWVYDAARDTWESRAPLPLDRAAHAAAVVDGRLCVVGGIGPEPQRLQLYDSAKDTWDLRAPMPRPREHLAAAGIGNKLYVVGGRWAEVGNVDWLEEYDPARDAWRPLAPMPTARGGLAAAALGGKLYVTGGEVLDETRHTFSQLEVFDPTSGAWAIAPSLPTPRHGLGAAVRDGELYVLAGGRLAGLEVSGVVEAYRPAG